MKYFLLVLTLITGGIPIYKNRKESYGKSLIAKSKIKIREHKITMYEWIILLIVLFATIMTTGIIQYHDNQQAKIDSVKLEGHFNRIINGLKADTSELHKTNLVLEQTRDTLRRSLDNNSLQIAKGIDASGKKLIKKIVSTTTKLNDQITGGNAFCIGEIVNMGNGSYELEFKNGFNNSIPNLLIKVMNNSFIGSCPFVIEAGKRIYQKKCIDQYSMQLTPTLYESNVPHLIVGSEQLFTINNKMGSILIEFLSPGYNGYRCFEEILYKLNGANGGPVRYRIIKKEQNATTELAYFNPNDPELNKISWNDVFESHFDLSYKIF
ncbi:MAG TPA: hypothetical protein VIJ27_08740 [Mucilaginibacter sp.]